MEDIINEIYNNLFKEDIQQNYNKIINIIVKDLLDRKTDTMIIKTDRDIKLFISFCYLFSQNINKTIKYHVCIDQEFTHNKISLMQLYFEPLVYKNKYVKIAWFINPENLNFKNKEIFIKHILINKQIYKIIHGGESLDIPYFYSFLGNREYILQMTSKIIDTRFICEYVKQNTESNKKCSLYDSLLFFQVIDNNRYDELNKINNSLGNVFTINWDINTLKKNQIDYAKYDILYLYKLLNNSFKINNLYHKKENEEQTLKFVPAITRFVFLERQNIIDIISKLKGENNVLNNKMFNKKSYISMYEEIIMNNKININFLLSISYFKNIINPLFKNIIYNILQKKSNNELYDKLIKNKLKSMVKLLKLVEQNVKIN